MGLMPALGTLLVFALVSFALVATPGPGLVYLVGRTAGEGRRTGFASMLGIEAGELVYLVCAGVGLSTLLARSTFALGALRYLGAGYLILLGIRAWRRSGHSREQLPTPARHAFTQGLVTQLLNPKVALFFVAYFPQFLRSDRPVALQVLSLGLVYLLVALATDSVYVLAASTLAARIALSGRARRHRLGTRIGALVYVALGLFAAASGDSHTPTRALGSLHFARR
jgi:threonine/homoserine/homoserine lactone efflux protein